MILAGRFPPSTITINQTYYEAIPSCATSEKRLELVLIGLFLLVAAVILTGIYFQVHHIDHNGVLVPAFFTLFGIFFLLLGRNALIQGNLAERWAPLYLFTVLKSIFTRLVSLPQGKVLALTRKIIGVLALLVSALCFGAAVWYVAIHG